MVLFIILLLVTVTFALLYRPAEPMTVPEAPRAYFEVEISLGAITPDEIVVLQGSLVTLNISSRDVQHTFELLGYNIVIVVPAMETVHIDPFLATLRGDFVFRCRELPPEHFAERGTFRVTPSLL